ncbi:MAG: hypothetical protein ACRDT6_28910 [Micromonosporaceae bacterium]
MPVRWAMRSGGRRHFGRGEAPWLELLRRPPRWLLGVAWLLIGLQLVVASGFLVAGRAAELTGSGWTPSTARPAACWPRS